jgi:hypothetical protein
MNFFGTSPPPMPPSKRHKGNNSSKNSKKSKNATKHGGEHQNHATNDTNTTQSLSKRAARSFYLRTSTGTGGDGDAATPRLDIGDAAGGAKGADGLPWTPPLIDLARVKARLKTKREAWIVTEEATPSSPMTLLSAVSARFPFVPAAAWPSRLAWGGVVVNGR